MVFALLLSLFLGLHLSTYCVAQATSGEEHLSTTTGFFELPFKKLPVSQLDLSDKDLFAGVWQLDNVTLGSFRIKYFVKLQMGTPGQENYVSLDTGSSDLYVIDPSSDSCQSHDSDQLIISDNFELTQTAAETSPTATYNPENFTPCSYFGTFDSNSSSTFLNNETYFSSFSVFDAETGVSGIFGKDEVTLGGETVHNVTFGIASDIVNTFGTLGLSIREAESSALVSINGDDPFQYDNILVLMKEQGLIERMLYSLYLNENNGDTGTVLFGAVNSRKYSGTLYKVPMIEEMIISPWCKSLGMYITVNSIGLEDSESGSNIISATQFPVMLDTGTTYADLPPEIADSIAEGVGAVYNEFTGAYSFECSKLNNTRLSFDFGGFNISSDLSNFVTYGEDSCFLNITRSIGHSALGVAFLKDIYVVFDLEAHEIAIAQVAFGSDQGDITVASEQIPGATPAPQYSNTYVYTPGDPIGDNLFYEGYENSGNVSTSGGSLITTSQNGQSTTLSNDSSQTPTVSRTESSNSDLSSRSTRSFPESTLSSSVSSARNDGVSAQPYTFSFVLSTFICALLV